MTGAARTTAAFAALASLALASGTLCAEKKPFERYQSILDRQPFGEPPPGFDPMRNPDEVQKGPQNGGVELTQDQETLQRSVQFSVINVEPDGSVMVGFTDKTDAKSPRHYYLAVGETRDGWLVKEADPTAATVTIVKDEVEITLDLGANSTPVASAKGGGRPSSGTGRTSLLNRTDGAAGPLSSFRGRRKAREMQEAADRAERERLKAEAEARLAEEQAAREQEKAEREAERAEQREQLMNIREELRRAREEKERARSQEEPQTSGGEGDSNE